MPILKSAIKKMRKDKKRTLRNSKIRNNIKDLLKNARKKPSKDLMAKAFSALDKAAKVHLIHPNKAARLKSRLAHLQTSK